MLSAICLVAVLEGLFLFVAPDGWRRAAEQLHAMPNRQLRFVGAISIALGLLALWWVRR
ncbi:DUF2065 family protein [Lysobacter spongiae]|uniref:DUF2065 family protein n=1 Tax=Marilutibacter spongiae TaxID=2025720 RepID=A0A7W3Y548_9GAMM|nr:DUF2065 family protein [Lysobacter spongiae]MBB1059837.1 DUF2065 family protein [Lysobacter spongiae]